MTRIIAAGVLALTLAACAKTETDGGAVDTAPAATAATPDSSAAATEPATTPGGLLDPNTATKEQLAAVAGMSPAIADALIAGRPYSDMIAVHRIMSAQVADSAARAAIYTSIFIPIDLNKATREEILLVPGVGRRMAREFEEYRPYTNIERFRKEIGKYVKPDEVARFERYVAIK